MEKVDALLVLGARVLINGQPSPSLARRIASASTWIQADKSGHVLLVVACGGRSWDGYVEADVIARELARQGVRPEQIERDRLSMTTLENLREGVARVQRRNGRLDQPPRLGLVTSDWHLPRAMRLGRALNLNVFGIPAATPKQTLFERTARQLREEISLWLDLKRLE